MNSFRWGVGLVGLVVLAFVWFINDGTDVGLRERRAVIPTYTQQSLPGTPKFHLLTYWGQNKIGQLNLGDAVQQEPTLAQLCASSPFDVINVAFMKQHFSTNKMPGLDLSFHCTTPFYGGQYSAALYVLLRCPNIASDIKTCQTMGKIVMLSIVPYADLTTAEEGVRSATNVWNSFLGGSGDRPFGDAVLDGVDLFLRENGVVGYSAFVIQLRSLMNADASGRRFYISASPRCAFPDPQFGPVYPNLPFTVVPTLFDFITLHFSSCTQCTFFNPTLAMQTLSSWIQWLQTNNPNARLMIGLPAADGYVDAAPGDFIPPFTLMDANFVQLWKSYGANSPAYQGWPLTAIAGVSLYDANAAMLTAGCADLRSYASLVRQLLDAPGNASSVAANCKNVSATATAKNTHAPSSGSNYIASGSSAAFTIRVSIVQLVVVVAATIVFAL